jgi:hypothetical protein
LPVKIKPGASADLVVSVASPPNTVPASARVDVGPADPNAGELHHNGTVAITARPPVPVLSEFRPKLAPPGKDIELVGKNFDVGIPKVTFNTTNAQPIGAMTPTTLHVNVPDGLIPAGATRAEVAITVATDGGRATIPEKFTVVGKPTLTGFSPATEAPNKVVTLTGSNFDVGGLNVKFNNVDAAVDMSTLRPGSVQVRVPTTLIPPSRPRIDATITLSTVGGSASAANKFHAEIVQNWKMTVDGTELEAPVEKLGGFPAGGAPIVVSVTNAAPGAAPLPFLNPNFDGVSLSVRLDSQTSGGVTTNFQAGVPVPPGQRIDFTYSVTYAEFTLKGQCVLSFGLSDAVTTYGETPPITVRKSDGLFFPPFTTFAIDNPNGDDRFVVTNEGPADGNAEVRVIQESPQDEVRPHLFPMVKSIPKGGSADFDIAWVRSLGFHPEYWGTKIFRAEVHQASTSWSNAVSSGSVTMDLHLAASAEGVELGDDPGGQDG